MQRGRVELERPAKIDTRRKTRSLETLGQQEYKGEKEPRGYRALVEGVMEFKRKISVEWQRRFDEEILGIEDD